MRPRIALIHFAVYFFTGTATVLLGPSRPLLLRSWHISDLQFGSLFAFQFGGAIVGSILSTYLGRRGYWIGCVCCALALTMMGWAPWAFSHMLFSLDGFGLCMIVNAGNQIVTRSAASSGTSGTGALAKVHFAWGVGALSCPWIIRAVIQTPQSAMFFVFLGAAFAAVAIGLLLAPDRTGENVVGTEMREHTTMSLPLQIYFGAALILYTGVENAISGWLPSYTLRLYSAFGDTNLWGPASVGSLSSLAFSLLWGAHLLGRACTPVAVRMVQESKLFLGTILSLLGSVLFLTIIPGQFRDHGFAICFAAAACGLSLAAIYPLIMASLLHQSGSPRGIGWVLSCAPIGGAFMPWVSGFVSSELGTVRAVFYAPCVATAILLALWPHLHFRNPADGRS